jgi:hypothetical protein
MAEPQEPAAQSPLPASGDEEAVVDAFRAAWQRGEMPPIGRYLPGEGAHRLQLLLELVTADIFSRRQRGQAACLELYL